MKTSHYIAKEYLERTLLMWWWVKRLMWLYLVTLWWRAVNCLDRHVHTFPERVALIWERDEPGSEVKVTYRSAGWIVCVCVCVSPCFTSCTVVWFIDLSLQAVTGDDMPLGQPVKAAWCKEGGLCHHLHASLPPGGGVHVGLCPHRCSTQRGVCRVQCRGPRRANHRRWDSATPTEMMKFHFIHY